MLSKVGEQTFDVNYPVDGGKTTPDRCPNDVKETREINPLAKSLSENLQRKGLLIFCVIFEDKETTIGFPRQSFALRRKFSCEPAFQKTYFL